MLTQSVNFGKLTLMTTKTLGQHIRDIRESDEIDMSLREMAGKLNVSPAFLSDIELGRRNPSDKMLVEIAKLLRTNIADLKTFDTRPPIDELRKKAAQNPTFGLAFRTVLESNIQAEELLKWAQQQQEKREKEQQQKKR